MKTSLLTRLGTALPTASLICLFVGVPVTATPPAGWTKTFEDTFDGPHLDASKWYARYIGFRKPWTSANTDYYFDPANGGTIVLRVNQSNTGPSLLQTAQGDYHQGDFEYDHFEPHWIKFDQRYGYFEIRARMRVGSGVGSFWLNLSDPDYYNAIEPAPDGPLLDNPTAREIDIFENHRDSKYKHNILYTDVNPMTVIHEGDYGFNFRDAFHIYALEWGPGYTKYYVDGVLKDSITDNRVPDKPMHILLGQYASINWSGSQAAETWPRLYEIDYIRVYQNPAWTAPGFGAGRVEAEDMILTNNCLIESHAGSSGGNRISVGYDRGLAEMRFTGTSGVYDLAVRYLDENDGVSSYALMVNSNAIATWSDSVNDSSYHTQLIPKVYLQNGASIGLRGTTDYLAYSHARVDYLDITASTGTYQALQNQALSRYLDEDITAARYLDLNSAATGSDVKWLLIDAGGGYYRIRAQRTNRFVALNGTDAILSSAVSGDASLWQVIDAGSGWSRLRNKANNNYLAASDWDVFGDSSSSGSGKLWRFIP